MGVIGGRLGYSLLKLVSSRGQRAGGCMQDDPYQRVNKLDVFYPQEFWDDVTDKIVVDFGCGNGSESVEMAKRGARHVIGQDIRQSVLEIATKRAKDGGVAERCTFTHEWHGQANTVVSNDAFEHFADPGRVLEMMSRLLVPGGLVWFAFGPPWYHPYGGHLFSVFPWAHLVFTERALIRWRSDFKADGAKRFSEVEGGLNQMSIRRFEKIVSASPFRIDRLELVPIRRLRSISNRLTREYVTSSIRGRLRLPELLK